MFSSSSVRISLSLQFPLQKAFSPLQRTFSNCSLLIYMGQVCFKKKSMGQSVIACSSKKRNMTKEHVLFHIELLRLEKCNPNEPSDSSVSLSNSGMLDYQQTHSEFRCKMHGSSPKNRHRSITITSSSISQQKIIGIAQLTGKCRSHCHPASCKRRRSFGTPRRPRRRRSTSPASRTLLLPSLPWHPCSQQCGAPRCSPQRCE